jgi:hypothetical protein
VMGVNFRETFCNGISHDHMLWLQCCMPSVLIFISYWAFWKTQFTKTVPHSLLKQDISAEVISISEETPAAVLQNFWCQLQMVMGARGACIENVFMWLSILLRLLNSDTKYIDIFYLVRYEIKTETFFYKDPVYLMWSVANRPNKKEGRMKSGRMGEFYIANYHSFNNCLWCYSISVKILLIH